MRAPQPQEGQELTMVNQRRLEAQDKLAALNLAPLDPIMPPKMDPGRANSSEVRIATNVYGLMIKPVAVYRYQLKIEGTCPPRSKTIEFTGPAKGDPVVVSRRADCLRIFKKLLEQHRSFFSEPRTHYFYDLKSILFTLKPLAIDEKQEFNIGIAQDFYNYLTKIVVTVQKVTDSFQLTTSDIKSYVKSDLNEVDRSLSQFLEIAINQQVSFDPENHVSLGSGGTSYFMDPSREGFSNGPPLAEGKYLAVGCQRSVRYVEGPRGRGFNNASCVVEVKKTPFHAAEPLMEKVSQIVQLGPGGRINQWDVEKLKRSLKGLYVQLSHRDINRILKINDVLSMSARNTMIPANERYGEIPIKDYFQRQYNLVLKYPDAPLVAVRISAMKEVVKFPMEVLNVVDNQRVTTEQQSREQIAQQIRACAVLPSVQTQEITKAAKAIGLFNNEHLKAIDVKVVPEPLQTNARILVHPEVQMGGNSRPIQVDSRGTWQGGVGRGRDQQRFQFLIPAACNKWEAYLIDPRARDAIDGRTFDEFFKRFAAEAASRGMKLGNRLNVQGKNQIPPQERALNEVLENAARNGVEFVFFIHAGNDTNLHGMMKYFELKGIITQDLKASTASNVVTKNQNQTMENIVMKTNVKLGGLNHTICISDQSLGRMLDPAVLYVGFGSNHPGGGLGGPQAGEDTPPTVVGYAANDNAHPFEFTGNYKYIRTQRDEKIDVIKDIFAEILARFVANRKAAPGCIVFYRNGTSEGQFGDIIQYEVPLVLSAIREKGYNTKLVVVVPNKMHNLRFVPANINDRERAPEQNVKPGMVVDTHVVHPNWNEFYLNSHTTLQGTAKVPRYTVLYNDSRLTADQLQEATYALAYGYQIVRSPTSLPAPAYIASKYADRGRTMLKAHMTFETAPASGPASNEDLNSRITYSSKPGLRGKRINA